MAWLMHWTARSDRDALAVWLFAPNPPCIATFLPRAHAREGDMATNAK
jgi:hypothetical protein